MTTHASRAAMGTLFVPSAVGVWSGALWGVYRATWYSRADGGIYWPTVPVAPVEGAIIVGAPCLVLAAVLALAAGAVTRLHDRRRR